MIEPNQLKQWIEERKKWLSNFSFSKNAIRELDNVIAKIDELEALPRIDLNVYNCCEEYENCTVQVLTNTMTGEISVGWIQNEH